MTGYRCHACEDMIESEPYLVLQMEERYQVYHVDCKDEMGAVR